MTVEVKICGLSTAHTVQCAARAGADYLGFVMVPRSPRAVTPEQARVLMNALDSQKPRPHCVALTADASDAVLETVIEKLAPDWLQLHGAETPQRVAGIKARFGLPVIKAVGIGSAEDLERASVFAAHADRLLLDARPPAGADLKGGTGTAFDWGLLSGWSCDVPWFLAGGLTPDTVGEALAATGARAVDVSSGVERARGIKAPHLIEAFLGAAKTAAIGQAAAIGQG